MGNAMYRKQNIPTGYQQWNLGQDWRQFIQSPVLTSSYPYQCITSAKQLIVSTKPFNWTVGAATMFSDIDPITTMGYSLAYPSLWIWQWTYTVQVGVDCGGGLLQANENIYLADYVTVSFSKTTTPAQDAGLTTSLIRIRNLHHKDGASVVRDKAAFWKDGETLHRINL